MKRYDRILQHSRTMSKLGMSSPLEATSEAMRILMLPLPIRFTTDARSWETVDGINGGGADTP